MARERSAEAKAELFEGVSISVLSQVFGMDRREVSAKLTRVTPKGQREGYSVYDLGEAARALVGGPENLAELLRDIKPKDFPPHLQGPYWEGQLKRLKFEEARGDLWRTEKVREVLLNVFRSLRTGIVLFQDKVEAQTSLNDEQRRIINQLSDELLSDMQRSLVEEFDLYDGSEDRPHAGVEDGL